jgi:uncharacterized protein (DUF58 family)
MIYFVKKLRQTIRNTVFTQRFYWLTFALAAFLVFAFIIPFLAPLASISLIAFFTVLTIDWLLLFTPKNTINGKRVLAPKLSNGDENEIQIQIKNTYAFAITCKVIDEIPFQFQVRDFNYTLKIGKYDSSQFIYNLHPLERGEYHFGNLLAYIKSPIGIFSRRCIASQPISVPVYPSYLQMQKYQLMAISNRLVDAGIKPIRKVGHHSEFDQIRNYIIGDDYRTINWKATARKAELMVNQYMEEKSQPVYCIIDKGRNMQSPFNGMTLLDYAINASLVMSNIALLKSDKAGLICFSKNMDALLPASNRLTQMERIMELLYKQQTHFEEPNYELLYATVKRNLTQRSLLLLFANFESPVSLQKQIKFLAGLAKQHVVLVILFKNQEMYQLAAKKPTTTEDIYIQTMAEKMIFDKSLIEKELKKHGILSLLTEPEQLTPSVINEYLKIKARGIL